MSQTGAENQIISKKRVTDHGEVFTHVREVNAMLDLVRNETERIDSRFLEPACGTGNFLLPVLEHKLNKVVKTYKRSQTDFERHAVIAVGSVYGIDLLDDNVETCRERLFKLFDDIYTMLYKKKCKAGLRNSVRTVLNHNIVVGNALTLKTEGKNPQPIIFSEWTLAMGSKVKRRDYSFEELIPKEQKDLSMFDISEVSDLGTPVFLPKPIREYPLTHVLHLAYENTY